MELMTKKGTNKYEFSCEFSLDSNSGWKESKFFDSKDIPNTEFNVLARVTSDKQSIDVQVQKSDLRKAVAVIKVQLSRQRPMISRVVDWKENVNFNNIIISFANDTCIKDRSFYMCIGNNHRYVVTVSCSIFWHGFVDDLYCSLGCRLVQNFYKSTEFSDIVIVVGDNKFPAHKNILARQSSMFHEMLTSNLKESGENSISLPGVDVNIIKEMILFFYHNKLNDAEKDEEMALKLFHFATMYQIDKLKTACEYLLVKNLKIDNVFDHYSVAKDCNLIMLQQHAITLIKNNIFEMGVISQKGKNEFTLHHKFQLDVFKSEKRSPALNTADTIDIPDTKFTIIAKKDEYHNLNIKIKKSNQRSAVAIIKVQFGNQKPIIYQFADWVTTVDLKNFLINLTLRGTGKNDFEVPINISVVWQGYIEEVYYLDVSNHMKNDHNNTEFSNLKISVEDSEFPTHKYVLAQHSPVFYKMLTSDMKESRENRISFPDADVGTIKKMLSFFYQRKLDAVIMDKEEMLKLFHFATMYQIDKLKTACEWLLIKNLKIENVCDFCFVANDHNLITLQQHALIFIENNASEILDATSGILE